MTITITHPGARLLAPALDILADVVAGDWTSAARLCAARLQDPAGCALDLDVAAARAGVTRSQRQPYRYRVHHRMLVVHEHPALLSAALDLQMKLWMGQWDALEQVAPSSRKPAQGWRPHELLEIRLRHQRLDTWSGRPYACQSLFLAPTTARLAHHVLTQLDGGSERHPYEMPAGPAAVHVG
ncbi:MAG: hypothetical protein ABIR39_13745 [Nocardioides sp.]|uniref:hypothetical protein n=1 Tax=Nocardioides sp. TaxID=35761 RepID=UPI00326725CC